MMSPVTPPRRLLRLFSSAHVFVYRLSGGRLGTTMNDLPVLLLTTLGRRTGRLRTWPLVYLRDGPGYVIAPGVVKNPAWYLNLRANPCAMIQVRTAKMLVEAQQAYGDERRRLWARVPAYWRDYESAQRGEMPLTILRVQITRGNMPVQSD